jgi:hypothetical protein
MNLPGFLGQALGLIESYPLHGAIAVLAGAPIYGPPYDHLILLNYTMNPPVRNCRGRKVAAGQRGTKVCKEFPCRATVYISIPYGHSYNQDEIEFEDEDDGNSPDGRDSPTANAKEAP